MPSLELSHSGMYTGTYMTDKARQHSMNQWGFSDTAPYVAVIGDAAKVSTITNAVYWGYHAALDI